MGDALRFYPRSSKGGRIAAVYARQIVAVYNRQNNEKRVSDPLLYIKPDLARDAKYYDNLRMTPANVYGYFVASHTNYKRGNRIAAGRYFANAVRAVGFSNSHFRSASDEPVE